VPAIETLRTSGAPFRRTFAAINTRVAGRALRAAAQVVAARHLDMRTEGLEHVPMHGPVVLAVRHYHHLHDGVVLLSALPRPLHILVALDWVDSVALRTLMEWATRTARWPTVLREAGLMPVANGTAPHLRSAFGAHEVQGFRRRALRDSVALLCEGAALVVFPEGYPNVDPRRTPKRTPNEFLPFRAGFASAVALAGRRLSSRVPVVPVGLAYEPGPRWRVTLRCGAPLYLDGRRAPLVRAVQARVEALSA
jgi:putative membrane protein